MAGYYINDTVGTLTMPSVSCKHTTPGTLAEPRSSRCVALWPAGAHYCEAHQQENADRIADALADALASVAGWNHATDALAEAIGTRVVEWNQYTEREMRRWAATFTRS